MKIMTYQSQSNQFGLTGLAASGLNNDTSRGMQLTHSQSVSSGLYSNTYTTTHNDVSYQTRLTPAMIKQKILELIEYLRMHHRYKQSTPATADDIFKSIHIDINSNESTEFIAECKQHPKIVIENDENTISKTNKSRNLLFYYRPYYPYHCTRDSLLELIKEQPMGIDTDKLLDSYLDSGNDLQWLYDNNYIIIIAGNLHDKIRNSNVSDVNDSMIIHSNELINNKTLGTHHDYIKQILQSSRTGKNISHLKSRCYIRTHNTVELDSDIKQLWHTIKLPIDSSELELTLADAGYTDINSLRTSYIDKTRRAAIQRKYKENMNQQLIRAKKKAEREANKSHQIFRKNQKITNKHLLDEYEWLNSAVGGNEKKNKK